MSEKLLMVDGKNFELFQSSKFFNHMVKQVSKCFPDEGLTRREMKIVERGMIKHLGWSKFILFLDKKVVASLTLQPVERGYEVHSICISDKMSEEILRRRILGHLYGYLQDRGFTGEVIIKCEKSNNSACKCYMEMSNIGWPRGDRMIFIKKFTPRIPRVRSVYL